jgi:hypothetical protein
MAVVSLQAKDQVVAERATFDPFLKGNHAGDEISALVKRTSETILRARTTEFENWVLRICANAGGTRVKNVSKALGSKHTEFVQQHKGDPARHCAAAIWELARPYIGK